MSIFYTKLGFIEYFIIGLSSIVNTDTSFRDIWRGKNANMKKYAKENQKDQYHAMKVTKKPISFAESSSHLF